VEVTALENWFKWQSMNVEAKSCPRCKTPVSTRLQRYNSGVWETVKDLNSIKVKISEIATTNLSKDPGSKTLLSNVFLILF